MYYKNLGNYFDEVVNKSKKKIAIDLSGEKISFIKLKLESNKIINYFSANNLGINDSICICLKKKIS